MENALLLTSILIMLEFFEAYMQRATTLYGVIEKLYGWYSKSIFFFFLMHPAFYFYAFCGDLNRSFKYLYDPSFNF